MVGAAAVLHGCHALQRCSPALCAAVAAPAVALCQLPHHAWCPLLSICSCHAVTVSHGRCGRILRSGKALLHLHSCPLVPWLGSIAGFSVFFFWLGLFGWLTPFCVILSLSLISAEPTCTFRSVMPSPHSRVSVCRTSQKPTIVFAHVLFCVAQRRTETHGTSHTAKPFCQKGEHAASLSP